MFNIEYNDLRKALYLNAENTMDAVLTVDLSDLIDSLGDINEGIYELFCADNQSVEEQVAIIATIYEGVAVIHSYNDDSIFIEVLE